MSIVSLRFERERLSSDVIVKYDWSKNGIDYIATGSPGRRLHSVLDAKRDSSIRVSETKLGESWLGIHRKQRWQYRDVKRCQESWSEKTMKIKTKTLTKHFPRIGRRWICNFHVHHFKSHVGYRTDRNANQCKTLLHFPSYGVNMHFLPPMQNNRLIYAAPTEESKPSFTSPRITLFKTVSRMDHWRYAWPTCSEYLFTRDLHPQQSLKKEFELLFKRYCKRAFRYEDFRQLGFAVHELSTRRRAKIQDDFEVKDEKQKTKSWHKMIFSMCENTVRDRTWGRSREDICRYLFVVDLNSRRKCDENVEMTNTTI